MGYTIASLVPPKTINGVEAYIILMKPFVRKGGLEKAFIKIYSSVNGEHSFKLDYVYKDGRETVYEAKLELSKNREYSIPEQPIEIPIKEGVGEHYLELYVDDKLVDKTYFIVEEPSSREPFYFTIVWHNHQAPNYGPDGKIHAPWAYVYVWGGYLTPYGYGPYHYHAVLLKEKERFRTTYNLSPSLLQQWVKAIEEGVRFVSGEEYDSGCYEVGLVREALEFYREAIRRNQIDVLTSLYAHTIAGFLVDVLDAGDIVDEEIAYGRDVTKKTLDYDAKGLWTPEMAFSMGLVPIYRANGIEYTVLDDKYHYARAEGDKDSIYEPYILLNVATGDYITCFFRDSELSNILGFKSHYASEGHAWRNAYEFSLYVARKWFNKQVKTLVLALDGENWMVFPKNPPLTAFFLDKLTDYLIALDDEGFIKLSHLREMVNKVPARRVLKHVPTNTWLGSFSKWRGEKADHEKYWVAVASRYRLLRAYERMIRGRDDYSSRARWCLWHALDSDYWWAEFWSPEIIDTWIREFDKLIQPRIENIRIDRVNIIGEPREGETVQVLIRIVNRNDREVSAAIRIGGLGIEVVGSSDIKPIHIKPSSSYDRIVKTRFIHWGRALISVAVTVDGYLIDTRSVVVDVKPYIRPNPV